MFRNILAASIAAIFILLPGCSADKYLNMKVPAASKILDANGETITIISRENRLPVSIDDISPYMTQV